MLKSWPLETRQDLQSLRRYEHFLFDSWSSSVAGDEGSYRSNIKSNLVFDRKQLSLLFW